MKLFLTVKPNAKQEKIEKINETHFVIAVKEPPVKGMANKAVLEALANYLGVSNSCLKIISGHTSRQKVVERSI